MIDLFKKHFNFLICLVFVAVVSLCGLFSMDSHAQEVDGKYQYCITYFNDLAMKSVPNSYFKQSTSYYFEMPYEVVGTFIPNSNGYYSLWLGMKDLSTGVIYSGYPSDNVTTSFYDYLYSHQSSLDNYDCKVVTNHYHGYTLNSGFDYISSTESHIDSNEIYQLSFSSNSFYNYTIYKSIGSGNPMGFPASGIDTVFDSDGNMLPWSSYSNRHVWIGGTLSNINANQNGMKIFKNTQACINYLNNPTSSNIVGLVCPENRIYKSESLKVQIEDSKSLTLGVPADFIAQKLTVFEMGNDPINGQPSINCTYVKDAQVVCTWNGDTEGYEDIFVDFFYEYHVIAANSMVDLANYTNGIEITDPSSVWKHWSGLTRCGVVSASEGGFKLSLLNLGMFSDLTETPNGTVVVTDKISIYARLRDKTGNYGVFVRCDMSTQTLNEDLTVVTLMSGKPSFSHDAYKVDETGYTHTTKPGASASPGGSGSGGTSVIPDINDISGMTSQFSILLNEATQFPILFGQVFNFLPASLITIIIIGVSVIIVIRILGR